MPARAARPRGLLHRRWPPGPRRGSCNGSTPGLLAQALALVVAEVGKAAAHQRQNLGELHFAQAESQASTAPQMDSSCSSTRACLFKKPSSQAATSMGKAPSERLRLNCRTTSSLSSICSSSRTAGRAATEPQPHHPWLGCATQRARRLRPAALHRRYRAGARHREPPATSVSSPLPRLHPWPCKPRASRWQHATPRVDHRGQQRRIGLAHAAVAIDIGQRRQGLQQLGHIARAARSAKVSIKASTSWGNWPAAHRQSPAQFRAERFRASGWRAAWPWQPGPPWRHARWPR